MDKEFNLIAVLRILIKWKRPIIIVTLISGVAAGIFSVFVMDEYFLSWSTIYPTNQYVTDRSMIFNTTNTGGQIEYFGSKTDVNRLISIANSEPVYNFLIDSFKLVQHYKIDTTAKYWRTRVSKKFDKNYEAIKTEHDAVKISIFDTDPKIASAMVNAAVDKIDQINKEQVESTKRNLYNLLAGQITGQTKEVADYMDTLSKLASEYKIKASAGAQGSVLVEGNDFRAVQLYKVIAAKAENAEKELNNRINIRDQLEVSLKSNSSSLFVVEKAFPADRREKPIRSLVVALTMLITAFVSIIGALLIEQFSEIRKQL
jgi:capsular polysaccharide biosynthesis protein